MPPEPQNATAPYSVFASYYDQLMLHVPYPKWAAYILKKAASTLGDSPKSILDIGCGTGKLLAHFQAQTQARLIGIDSSIEMIKKAKCLLDNKAYLFCANLTDKLPLPSCFVELLISTHDSLNYITKAETLGRHFKEASRIAQKGALYICDFVSLSNIQHNFHGQVRKERLPGGKLIWNNHYDPDSRLLTSQLKFITATGKTRTETHRQRYWPPKEVREILNNTGWQILWEEGDYQENPFRVNDSFCVYGLQRKT